VVHVVRESQTQRAPQTVLGLAGERVLDGSGRVAVPCRPTAHQVLERGGRGPVVVAVRHVVRRLRGWLRRVLLPNSARGEPGLLSPEANPPPCCLQNEADRGGRGAPDSSPNAARTSTFQRGEAERTRYHTCTWCRRWGGGDVRWRPAAAFDRDCSSQGVRRRWYVGVAWCVHDDGRGPVASTRLASTRPHDDGSSGFVLRVTPRTRCLYVVRQVKKKYNGPVVEPTAVRFSSARRMHWSKHAYFTTWSIYTLVAAVVYLVFSSTPPRRADHTRRASVAAYYLVTSVLLGVVGSDVVAYRLDFDPCSRVERAVLRTHLLLHMLPLVGAVLLLRRWSHWIGRPPTTQDCARATVTLAFLFALWLTVPLPDTGQVGLRKFAAVYDVQRPTSYIARAACVPLLSAYLLRESPSDPHASR
jgi:hypothetical protein